MYVSTYNSSTAKCPSTAVKISHWAWLGGCQNQVSGGRIAGSIVFRRASRHRSLTTWAVEVCLSVSRWERRALTVQRFRVSEQRSSSGRWARRKNQFGRDVEHMDTMSVTERERLVAAERGKYIVVCLSLCTPTPHSRKSKGVPNQWSPRLPGAPYFATENSFYRPAAMLPRCHARR